MLQSTAAVESPSASSSTPLSLMGLNVPIEVALSSPLVEVVPDDPGSVDADDVGVLLVSVGAAVVSPQLAAPVHVADAGVVPTESVPESGSEPQPSRKASSAARRIAV